MIRPPPFPKGAARRRRRIWWLIHCVLAGLFVIGVIHANGTPAPPLRDDGMSGTVTAERWVSANLIDPDSAHFANVVSRRVIRAGHAYAYWLVCGTVNARNRFGGYAGAQPFYVWVSEFANNANEGAINPSRLPPECARRPTQAP